MSIKKSQMEKLILGAPAVVTYFLIMILPILLTIYYGFTNWDGFSRDLSFVGFANFIKAVNDVDFIQTIKFTLVYSFVLTIAGNVVGLLFAQLLNRSGVSTNIFRSIFFIPLLISPIAAGFIWKALLNYTGIINVLLGKIGFSSILFIGSESLSKISISVFSLWQTAGFCMIIYLAGLQTVPKDLYDSAYIDGASAWQRFRSITLPFLAPATTNVVTFLFTGFMREYDRVLVLTAGGPVGKTETVAMRLLKVGFDGNKLAYASAMAFWILLLTALLSLLITHFLRKREDFLK